MRDRGGTKNRKAFHSWYVMRRRCYNEKDKDFCKYGGRGIVVCDRWEEFDLFLADMGQPKAGQSLDRKNNNLGYSPGNCRWATAKQQANNRRSSRWIGFGGETHTLAQWAEKLDVRIDTLWRRLDRGISLERALKKCHRLNGRLKH